MVAVQGEAVFPLHLIAVGLGRGGVWKFRRIRICVFQALSAFTLVMQSAHHQLAYPPRRHIRPSVHYIVLPQLGHIHKSVVIAIVVHLTVLEMEKGCRRKAVGKMYASVQVDFCLQFVVLIDVCPYSVSALRLEKLFVYLSRSALIPVFHT